MTLKEIKHSSFRFITTFELIKVKLEKVGNGEFFRLAEILRH